jgi:ammonium transporter Rh
MEKAFAFLFLLFTAGMVALYGGCAQYADPVPTSNSTDAFERNIHIPYSYLQDMQVMVFVGFGFMMSFLHRGGFTATGHAFLVAAYSILWAILNRAFWTRAIREDSSWPPVVITVTTFVEADYAAAAMLVSFGALLGRITSSQLLIMAIWEIIVYSINEQVLQQRLQTTDNGKSMSVHVFGAMFGLTASFVLEMVRRSRNLVPNLAGSTRVTDTMAMVGTLFLFCFWPSYNAATVGLSSQDRAISNTILSMVMSCSVAFFMSCILDSTGRFGMADVQYATIAGGIAMGSAAGMVVNPYGAMIVGGVAGMVSTFGFRMLTPRLERLGLRDTCGVMNLHFLPGFIGGIVSTIAAGARRVDSYQGTEPDVFADPSKEPDDQAGVQFAGLWVSIGFGLVGGAIGGLILAVMPVLPAFFDDVYEYLVPDEHQGSMMVTVQKVNDPLSGAPNGEAGTTVSVSRTEVGPTTWSFTNAPSATQHGATLFPARPIVLSTSDAPAMARPYGAEPVRTSGDAVAAGPYGDKSHHVAANHTG